MVECELCGSKRANRKAKVEGVILNICNKCVKYGEEIPSIQFKKVKKPLRKIEELEKIIKPGFHKIIRNSREKMKLTQDQLAKKLKEKASVIKRIEEGWEPPLVLIRKIERFFDLKLIEELEEGSLNTKTKRKKLTIGDIVEVR